MRRVLPTLVALYWAVFFGLLAGAATLEPARGAIAAFTFIGAEARPETLLAEPVSALFSLVFAVVAVLFAWSFVSGLLGGGDEAELSSLAFGAGAGGLTLMLLAAAWLPLDGVPRAVALQLAAMTACYLAVGAERPRGIGPAARQAARAAGFGPDRASRQREGTG